MRLFSKLSDAGEYSKVEFGLDNPIWRIKLDGEKGMIICKAKWVEEALIVEKNGLNRFTSTFNLV